MRAITIAAACVLSVTVVGVCARSDITQAEATTAASGMANRTALLRYAAFAGSRPARGVTVVKTARGTCWTSALTDWRSEAWRCFGPGSVIHDPCFSSTTRRLSYVLCPLYTPTSHVLRIELTRPLPRPDTGRDNSFRHPPWAIQLNSGAWCISRGGINGIPSIHGKDVTYLCQRAKTNKASQFGNAGVLVGPPQRLSTGWKIEHATGQRITTVAVRSAWW
jgi:hypothetical protein